MDLGCSGALPAVEVDEDDDGEPICAGDCADTDPARFSSQVETCGNALDDNCNETVDEDCSDPTDDATPAPTTEQDACGCNGLGSPGGAVPVVLLALAALRRPASRGRRIFEDRAQSGLVS